MTPGKKAGRSVGDPSRPRELIEVSLEATTEVAQSDLEPGQTLSDFCRWLLAESGVELRRITSTRRVSR